MTKQINGHLREAATGPTAPTNPATLLNDLATQFQESGDPALQLLSVYLLSQSGGDAQEAIGGEPDGHLREELIAAWAEIEVLRRRVALVAAALGRCDVCWGDDLACHFCQGRGSSGYFWPDRTSYEELIAPAVARVRETGRHTPAVERVTPDPTLAPIEAPARTGADRPDRIEMLVGREEGGTG